MTPTTCASIWAGCVVILTVALAWLVDDVIRWVRRNKR